LTRYSLITYFVLIGLHSKGIKTTENIKKTDWIVNITDTMISFRIHMVTRLYYVVNQNIQNKSSVGTYILRIIIQINLILNLDHWCLFKHIQWSLVVFLMLSKLLKKLKNITSSNNHYWRRFFFYFNCPATMAISCCRGLRTAIGKVSTVRSYCGC